MTLLGIAFSLVPVVQVASAWVFALKVTLTALVANLVGAAIYWRGNRIKGAEDGSNA